MATAGTNGMVITCTGLEERQQNELYLLAQDMQATLLRDKVAALYDTRTTHLVIGSWSVVLMEVVNWPFASC